MMKQPGFRLLLSCLALSVLGTGPAFGQFPSRVGQPTYGGGGGFNPALNYLNLRQPGNPAINYYGLVVPQQQFGDSISKLGDQVGTNQAGIATLQQEVGLVGTGTRSYFLSYQRYFLNNTVGAQGLRPGSTLGGGGQFG